MILDIHTIIDLIINIFKNSLSIKNRKIEIKDIIRLETPNFIDVSITLTDNTYAKTQLYLICEIADKTNYLKIVGTSCYFLKLYSGDYSDVFIGNANKFKETLETMFKNVLFNHSDLLEVMKNEK